MNPVFRKGIAPLALGSVLLVVGLVAGAGAVYLAGPSLGFGSTSTSTKTFVSTNTLYSTLTSSIVSTSTQTQTQTQTQTTTQTQTQTTTQTQVSYVTNIQYSTQYLTVTSISTVAPHGTVSFYSSAVEIIPSGSSSLPLAINFPAYDGDLLVSYTATNSVSLSYAYGQTMITTPNSGTGTNLVLPILVTVEGSVQYSPIIYVENGACGILGCPSITLTITATYYY